MAFLKGILKHIGIQPAPRLTHYTNTRLAQKLLLVEGGGLILYNAWATVAGLSCAYGRWLAHPCEPVKVGLTLSRFRGFFVGG